MAEMMTTIPVKVILNPEAGLLGAATAANAQVQV
jgi:glucokinase